MAALGRFSDRRTAMWLNELETIWLGLAYDNPDVSGAYASEIFGGSYTRQLVTMGIAENRAIFNISSALFTGLPAIKATHIVGWDSQYNGNYEFMVPMEEPIIFPAGASFPIAAYTLALSFS